MERQQNYPVIGYCKTGSGAYVPILDIPMMSDEEWNIGAKRNAVSNYINHFHRTPPNIATAQKWQQQLIDEMWAEKGGTER